VARRNLARAEHDFHRIETIINIIAVEKVEITVGGVAQGLLLGRVNRLGGLAEGGSGAGADLDKGEDFTVTTDEIDLAPLGLEIAIKHAVTLTATESRSDPLTVGANFTRRRQLWRWRMLVSAQTFADGLQKGRDG
jgi:hypothetical protein